MLTEKHKVNLIRKHAREYYEYPRKYLFVTGGFVQYSIRDVVRDSDTLVIHELYVDSDKRGSSAFNKLIRYCLKLDETFIFDNTYCSVDQANPFKDGMHIMLLKQGFEVINKTITTKYYKRPRQDRR